MKSYKKISFGFIWYYFNGQVLNYWKVRFTCKLKKYKMKKYIFVTTSWAAAFIIQINYIYKYIVSLFLNLEVLQLG